MKRLNAFLMMVLLSNSAIVGATVERVTGIGGVFFRSENPQTLAKWYFDNLGIDLETSSPWVQEKGPTVFAPFDKKTTYWPSGKQWMLNFRVRNLDAMVSQLRKNGIEVDVDPKTYPYGRFARLTDPESNAIELWELK